jgi:hypothetical protein
MKRIAVLIVISFIILSGCRKNKDSSDSAVQAQTEQAMREANAQVGMPAIKNYQEKKLAKMIYELRDQEKLICYAYLKSLDGKPVFLGKCVGFGLPYCVQFSNPEKIVRDGRRMSNLIFVGTLPQPEPNGLFMPQSLSATWLMMIDPETNEARPVYIEPEIIVSPFKLL